MYVNNRRKYKRCNQITNTFSYSVDHYIIRITLSTELPAVMHRLWDSPSEYFSHASTPTGITDVTADDVAPDLVLSCTTGHTEILHAKNCRESVCF